MVEIKGNEIQKQMMCSNAFMMLLTEAAYTSDIFAYQLGLAIMLNKPILIISQVGVAIPQHLVKIADLIESVDLKDEGAMEIAKQRIGDYMKQRFGSRS